MKNKDTSSYKKILIIQTAFLGDVIMSTPLVRAARQTFPDAKIDVLTIPETAIVFEHNPHVNEILHFDKRQLRKKLVAFFKVVSQIRSRKYDLAISIQSSMTSSLLMLLGGVPERTGFARQKLVTMPVTHKRGYHVRIRYLKLLKYFSDEEFDAQSELFWTDQEESKAEKLIAECRRNHKFVLGVAPGSIRNTKQYPKHYYAELLRLLKNDEIQVVLFGAKNEQQLCKDISRDSASDAMVMAGKLSVLESAALIEKVDLMLTNDSAPLHIANAVKTDVYAFFGPTVRRFGCYPYRSNDRMLEIELYCRPCSKHGTRKCPESHFRCMLENPPHKIYPQIKAYFKDITTK
ncbi:lipopolysaccharide heptosyltransferase II [candidate division KSB1 bacterium]|nr:lipopolysaccharide heptosyltransferase II [candidate division KSB1 bacterium]